MHGVLIKLFVAIIFMAVALTVGGLIWWFEYYRHITFEDVAADKAQLIDQIQSYVTVENFLRQLDARSLTYELKRPKATNSSTASHPPFRVTTVKIDRFSDLGYTGELYVAFFNDRLASVRFYTLDIDGYRGQLLSQKGIDILTGPFVFGSTRIWSATDHMGKMYIGWEDVRLAEEFDLWIKRYS